MKKILLAALCLIFAMTVQANRKNYVLKLENGNFVSVENVASRELCRVSYGALRDREIGLDRR